MYTSLKLIRSIKNLFLSSQMPQLAVNFHTVSLGANDNNLSILKVNSDDLFLIFPTLVKDILYIRSSNTQFTPCKIEILNRAGAKVMESQIDCQDQGELNLLELAKGQYIINITTENNGRERHQFIKIE